MTENKDPLRLIVALNKTAPSVWRSLFEEIGDAGCCFRVAAAEYGNHSHLVDLVGYLRDQGKYILIDLRALATPESTRQALQELSRFNVDAYSVSNSQETIAAARSVAKGATILTTTVLTTVDEDSAVTPGTREEIEEIVVTLTANALDAGCDGIITSGIELPCLRNKFGHDFFALVPGIRDSNGDTLAADNQKRTVSVEEAFARGANAIMVGRPITLAKQPLAALNAIQTRIDAIIDTRIQCSNADPREKKR
ncbi:orotidine 5'-phosphate decarboxylase / HUMPS family protein [uncultured Roseobacter sp.]|uniref:orotidine 5'-phosphate decarboxylase / HUMPS family protein n=1 Tax=uncultured Roseobacter sp. TaxID=114847 RepID=UPI0026091272|nr:orotidine 5'-phosphate decarboxylase / HUMPS family protein [uncultured Roseobacter sp.]